MRLSRTRRSWQRWQAAAGPWQGWSLCPALLAPEIEDHFKRHFDVSGVTTACEYLADKGLISNASTPVHLTKKSNVEVQELAFFYPSERPDGF